MATDKQDAGAKPIADEALDEAAGGAGETGPQVAASPTPKRKTEQTRQVTLIQDI